jgi:SAM-dependent methyltransferase
MTSPPIDHAFSSDYAAAYDKLYMAKDYAVECDALERVFAEFADFPVRRILDLGCGTGGHAVPLADRGYDVIGVDRSGPMLDVARAKADAFGLTSRIALIQSDLAHLPDIEACDAALMMFAVLGYLGAQDTAQAVLRAAHASLRDDALLVFDVWYAPAVLRDPPQSRWLMVEEGGVRLIRLASSILKPACGLCAVTFRLIVLEGDRIVSETVEEHQLRFFSDQQIEDLLDHAGFDLLCIGGFPDYRREPGYNGWSAMIIARARRGGTRASRRCS